MKGYRSFIIIFTALLILSIIAEINKPTPTDWGVTLSKDDKNPYGGFIVYRQLTSIFPQSSVHSFRNPVYDQVNNTGETNTAYFIIGDAFKLSASDFAALRKYVKKGNAVIASANTFSQPFLDSFGLETVSLLSLKLSDSTGVNFVNPALKSGKDFRFIKSAIDQFFSKFDTLKTTVLSVNNKNRPVFIKIAYGRGNFFIHANPVCFSNYFLLTNNNALYTAKALSYLPKDIKKIYWDEFYKLGPEGAGTPLRFFLSNQYLRWALRIALAALLLYVFFEMKRRQRIIPVSEPLKNSTLDFVKTVAAVYFNEKDNKGIADKKTKHFFDFVRNRFNITAQTSDEDFIEKLHRKSGVEKEQIEDLVSKLSQLPEQWQVTDEMLLTLDRSIDNFYKKCL